MTGYVVTWTYGFPKALLQVCRGILKIMSREQFWHFGDRVITALIKARFSLGKKLKSLCPTLKPHRFVIPHFRI